MTGKKDGPDRPGIQETAKAIGRAEQRALRARKGNPELWYGIGTFGIVGWSIAITTLIGVWAGMYLDSHWPQRYSWTLALLVAGLCAGCYNAWRWIAAQEETLREPPEDTGKDDGDD